MNIAQLLLLAAIWGGSFLFMRMATHVFGPVYLVEGRLLLGSLCMLGVGLWLKRDIKGMGRHWKQFFIFGLLNCVLPFVLFAICALKLSAAQSAILNSTAPIWGFLIGAVLGVEKFTYRRLAGLVLGVAGVVTLFFGDDLFLQSDSLWAAACGLTAALCYGIATNYARGMTAVDPVLNSGGSLLAGAIVLVPALFFVPVREVPDPTAWGALAGLGLLCSGFAFLIYFNLVKALGPASTLTVTFLIPVFATLWGALFLHEQIGLHVIISIALIITGTTFVVRKPKPVQAAGQRAT
ncbi:MAG: DMT family transporter [Alphaproteobacteria bacterium]|nr:DMT family transporter [Alphaproteobacteria bacterium]MBV8549480.1 DMT family transporter [Alphaproteobacteria bacterium]